jgi:hypothetical protein
MPEIDVFKYVGLLGRRARYPLTTNLRVMADYWKRIASDVSSAVPDREIDSLYFDDWGRVVAAKVRGQPSVGGKPVDSPPGTEWACVAATAKHLERLARWAEYVLADHLYHNVYGKHGRAPVSPEVGPVPDEIVALAQAAKREAEDILRKRGEIQ